MTPTESAVKSLAMLAARMTFRELVDVLASDGHITSISHLSRIRAGQRESSPELAAALKRAVRNVRA